MFKKTSKKLKELFGLPGTILYGIALGVYNSILQSLEEKEHRGL